MTDFNRFWQAYPRKVGKGEARKCFERLESIRPPMADLLEAIEAYKRNKPDYADWCHPATWLRQERWDDEWESEQQMSQQQIDYWQGALRDGRNVPPDILKLLPETKLRIVE